VAEEVEDVEVVSFIDSYSSGYNMLTKNRWW
jgi:hypothetical protein